MSSLLDLHLDDHPDPTIVEGNEEYQLQITSIQQAPSKSSDRNLIKASFTILDRPEALPIFHNFSLPMEGDPEKNVFFFKTQLKQFIQAQGLDVKKPGDPEGWKGNEFWAFVKAGKNEQSGADENSIARFIVKK